MEVLNQNQRKNALLRIIGVGAFILLILFFTLFSMRFAYGTSGDNAISQMQSKIDSVREVGIADSLLFQQQFDSLIEVEEVYVENNNEEELRAEIRKLNENLVKLEDKHDKILKNTRDRELELEIQLQDCP